MVLRSLARVACFAIASTGFQAARAPSGRPLRTRTTRWTGLLCTCPGTAKQVSARDTSALSEVVRSGHATLRRGDARLRARWRSALLRALVYAGLRDGQAVARPRAFRPRRRGARPRRAVPRGHHRREGAAATARL